MAIPFSHYFNWVDYPDKLWNNIISEFKDNGVDRFVLTDGLLKNCLSDPWGLTRLKVKTVKQQISFGDAHLPYGQPYDLCCAEKGRRPQMLEDQKRAMACAAELGCKTCTIHIGAYESIFYHTPNSELRPHVIDSLGILLEEAEKLDIIIAIENSYERSNATGEILYYMSCFDNPHLGVCYDSGHACLMTDFPGKSREKYFSPMDSAWGEVVECYPDALGDLLPHIVTCHLHDNDGYSDAHQMPGKGRINWPELIAEIRTAPRLVSMQSEVSVGQYAYSIRHLAETFRKIIG